MESCSCLTGTAASAEGFAPRTSVVACDEFAVPSHLCLRCDIVAISASVLLPSSGALAASLRHSSPVRQSRRMPSCARGIRFPSAILDGMLLLLIHAPGNSNKQKAERVQRLPHCLRDYHSESQPSQTRCSTAISIRSSFRILRAGVQQELPQGDRSFDLKNSQPSGLTRTYLTRTSYESR